MYLYVDKTVGLKSIPEALQQTIGQTELAMTLLISEDKKLARAKAKDVLESIADKGFYLQMPPSLYELNSGQREMGELHEKNSKL